MSLNRNSALRRKSHSIAGALAPVMVVGIVGADKSFAELIQVSFLSYGMLPGGQMRAILADGRNVVFDTHEYTFLDGRLYVDSSSLARVQATPAAVVIQDSGYGYAGPVFNDPVQSQLGAANASLFDSTLDFIVSPPVLLSGGAVMIGAGAVGLADLFGWTSMLDEEEEDDLILEPFSSIPSAQLSEGTQAGHIIVAALDGYYENIEGTLSYNIRVITSSGATITNVIGISGGQIVTLTDITDANSGLYTVELTAIDSEDGDRAVQTFSVLFDADDASPTVDQGLVNQTVQENSAFSFTIPGDAFDDDEGGVTLSVDQTPEGITFNPSNNTFTGTPTKGGTTTITVTATDSMGQTVSTIFDIIVTNVNDAPELSGVSDPYTLSSAADGSQLDAGDTIYLDLTTIVIDDDGDALTFSSADIAASGYSLTSGGLLTGIANSNDDSITIDVDDGNSGSLTFVIDVDVFGV